MGTRFVVWLVAGVSGCSAFSGDSKDEHPASSKVAGDGGAAVISGPAIDLAVGQQTPADIIVDATSIYWINQASGGKHGAVVKLAKGGGEPVVLAPDVPAPYNLVSDATRLYFTDNDDGFQYSFLNVYRQDKVGGPAEQRRIGANGTIFGCTVQSGVVYWAAEQSGYSVGLSDANAAPWSSSPAAAVASNLDPITVLAADLDSVYAASPGKILKLGKADGRSTLFAATTGIVKALAFDAATASLYWAEASAVRSLETSRPGAPPKDLATGQQGPSAIALDATNIYWTDVGDGSIRVVAKTGGPSATVATGESEPFGIAVDASGVYWTNHGDNRVRAVRRP